MTTTEINDLTKLADHANAVESLTDLSVDQRQGEYRLRYADWKRAMVAVIREVAAASGWSVSDDDRAGSSYVTLQDADESEMIEVRVSDHDQKYGGPDVAIRMDRPGSWDFGISEIKRLIEKKS